MKNRKRIVVGFLLCAMLLVGVGFAALTGSLRADGIVHINLDDTNLQVQYKKTGESATFSNAGASNSLAVGTDVKVEYASEDTVATITVAAGVLKVKGDTVTVELPIINNSADVDASVKKPTVTMQGNATTYLTTDGVTAVLENADASGNITLKCADNNSGVAEEGKLIITVTLNAVPTESNVTCNFSVAINTESVAD